MPDAITPKTDPQGQSEINGAANADMGSKPQVLDSNGQSQTRIPEKMRGKSIDEVVDMYSNAESELGKVRAVAQEKQREAEELKRLLDSRPSESRQEPTHTTPTVTEEEIFRKEWEDDPAKASFNQSKRAEARAISEISNVETRTFYERAKEDGENFPGFKELEPRMIQLAREHADIVDPRKVNSPKVVNLLYKLACAEVIDQEVERARQEGAKQERETRDEKNAAQVEGSSSTSQGTVPFEDLSLTEMEKLLGVVER